MGGVIVTPQVPAAEAGARVLMDGGNAVDAAVTAAFVQMLVDPQNCGVAGFGVANIRTADGQHHVLDFNGTAGSKASEDMWQDIVEQQDWTGYGYHLQGRVNDVGYKAIMTPGTVAGLAEVLKRFGTISWADALQPAITIANDGFLVSPDLWRLWNQPVPGVRVSMLDRMRNTDASEAIYFKPNGQTWEPGERLQNPDYGATLQRLAEAGPEDFYTGELASKMLEDFERNGAFITAEDLASFRVRDVEPIVVSYRGYQIVTNPPAGGGICVAEIMKIVEREDIAALGLNSLEYIDLVGHAMKAGYYDWYKYVGDPEFTAVPVDRLLSDDNTGAWYKRIKQGEQFDVPRYPEPPDTTHVSVVDNTGNCVAITHSLGSSGGVVTPGLGFTYNNIMNAANPVPGKPNSIAHGKSRITGMCPTIVLQHGEPVLVLGAPGGTRIITGVLQAILNVLDHGLTAVEAVSAPRFDCQSDVLDAEARIPSWIRDGLRSRGFDVTQNAASFGSFARVQAITRDSLTGRLNGGSDPRVGGAVLEV